VNIRSRLKKLESEMPSVVEIDPELDRQCSKWMRANPHFIYDFFSNSSDEEFLAEGITPPPKNVKDVFFKRFNRMMPKFDRKHSPEFPSCMVEIYGKYLFY
jgi:hypothetical protein